ncbi:MAG: tryptophan synthase subunit alpha [Candidatus Auribacterota bacterium]
MESSRQSRIQSLFTNLRNTGRTGFVAYITAGDPTIEFTEKLIPVLEKAGVDLLEVGVPFSDPLADGPVIQDAADRALKHNTNLDDIFSMIKHLRTSSELPIILFTYLNPLFQYGVDRFALSCKESGVDGALVLDLPPEESAEYKAAMDKNGLDTVFVMAPTTSETRMKLIADASSGFIYYVSRTGVTGEKSDVSAEIGEKVRLIRSVTNKPIAIGFGVSNPDQVSIIAKHADAVVVGSAIVRHINEFKDSSDIMQCIGEYVSSLVQPLKK